jgi:FMNH2-dependent dimethyl sulfone monooxygenase
MERTHPVYGPNPFKLGVFSANCDGGLTISTAPERWRASWDDIVELARIADESTIEFLLPVAKWKGFRGQANIFGWSFETLTHSAALAGQTKRIGLFSTIHMPVVTPAFAAKAIATVDHASHGRAGINLVCGWNKEEFDVHGVSVNADNRYDHGLEWFQIWSKLLEGGPEFDWDGQFFKLKGLDTAPLTVQRPHPPVMSAGFSPKGRDFAARAADVLFTTMTELDQGPGLIADIKSYVARYDRKVDIYTMSHVVCRPTRKEAEDFYYYFAEEMADRDAIEHRKVVKPNQGGRPFGTRFTRATGKSYVGSYPGAYPMVGTPDEIVEEMQRMSALGLTGTSVSFLNYLDEIPYFLDEVVPRMERVGLRLPARAAQQAATR